MRSLIGTLACSYSETDEDFKEVFDELYPGEKAMECLNWIEEE